MPPGGRDGVCWKTTTRLGGRLFVLDEREVPERIERLAGDAAAAAMDRFRYESRGLRLT
ncbi:hypothetical protein [Streptomyces sp. AC550_RSS872]|uniref:hypothetical protein n=1 Tax=Streptomyces sp. AC550_RSS872 TaxID=2823689 RepID=UPI0020B820CB|nr:hypothetical protein [Streptomyces sp. AC550_RSS872]